MDDGSSTMMTAMLVILVILSAFFSASETAYSSLNQIRLKSRADSGDEQAKKVLTLSKRYDSLLSTILIGNNIVNISMSSIGTVLFTQLLGGYGPTVSTVVITVVVLVFGEITPKSLAKEMPEKFAIFSAPALNVLIALFTPLNLLFGAWKKFLSRFFGGGELDVVTDAELLTMVGEAENDGELTDHESELIRSAIEFDDVEVAQILTPRVDVVAVSDEDTMDDLAETFVSSGYSRLPVYHETIDNIIGVVHEKDYYAAMRRQPSATISELLSPTMYTTGTTQISELLRQLKEKQQHLAVVVDEYGGTDGIVTLEDIIEELVGEIWDEHDEAVEEFRQQSDGSWLVAGSASITDLFETLSIPEDEDISSMTVSGLVQEATSRLPKVGDQFAIDRYDGEVTKTAHRRVLEVRLRENAAPGESHQHAG